MEKFKSVEVELEGLVLVVSHDAGGAEILSSMLVKKKINYLLCLEGPAVNIFSRKLDSINICKLEESIERADTIITGTSWASDLEYRAIVLAKKRNKKVISFLDNWKNYRERFSWHGPEVLPNEIWVGDEEGYDACKKLFSDSAVKLYPNYYWIDIKNQVEELGNNLEDNSIKILFISSNIDGFNQQHSVFDFSDKQILNKCLDQITEISSGKKISEITISLHPSEKEDKYSYLDLEKYDFQIKINRNKDMINLLNSHTHVAGYDSMVLVLASICGKKTINLVMSSNKQNTIPKKYIDFFLK